MTEQETGKVMSILLSTYHDRDASADVIRTRTLVWSKVFADIPYEAVSTAVLAYIANDANGRYMPTPGMIRETLYKTIEHDGMTGEEAWALVRKAITFSGYGSKEQFDKLPPICQRIVGSPTQLRDWAMSSNFNQSVEKSLFLKAYERESVREKEDKKLPQAIKNLIGERIPRLLNA